MAKPKTAKSSKAESLLVELLTEELPPKSLKRLSEAFAAGVLDGLSAQHFLSDGSKAEPFATPRRLAVRIGAVLAVQPDRVVERKGPSVAAGIDAAGKPTPALIGFARSCGVDPEKLQRRKDEKGEYFFHQAKQKGEPLGQHLTAIIASALKKLPVAKLMRWGNHDAQFVRPVHGILLLHGNKVVPGTVFGLKSGNKTRGHRFMSTGSITVSRADDYENALERKGKVIADFVRRRDRIVSGLIEAAGGSRFINSHYIDGSGTQLVAAGGFLNATGDIAAATWILQGNEDLLDEVTALVEWPVVYPNEFEDEFLAIPAQCISLTMQKNQKYFALVNQQAELSPTYLIVSNIKSRASDPIIDGNARVLRARLSDAKFFYDQDRKVKLANRVPRLASVVYHNKLGSQLERVQRLERLTGHIASALEADPIAARRAANLSKADLLTDMVGEFPELQGLMGYYYARRDGETDAVADAIREQYLPRFAGDVVPRTPVGICLALADKLDTLVGIFSIGLTPTGDKDPFGLRRAAIGVLRILIECKLPLDIKELFAQARAQFQTVQIAESIDQELLAFLYDRLRPYLRDKGYAADEIEAVLALEPTRLDHVLPRLEAIQKFRSAPEGQALAAANKRIQNILRQAGDGDPDKVAPAIDASLFQQEAEKELARQLGEVAMRVQPLTAAGDFSGALMELSRLRGAVDTFFDKVMVMVEEENLRTARLQLLAQIRSEFRGIADISKLQG